MERHVNQLRRFGKTVWLKLSPNFAKKEKQIQIAKKWKEAIISFSVDGEPTYLTRISFGDKKLYGILDIDWFGKGGYGQLLIPVKNLIDMNYKKISVINSLALVVHDFSFIGKALKDKVGEFNLTSQGTARTYNLIIENFQVSEKRRITKRPVLEYPGAAEDFVKEFNDNFQTLGLILEPTSPLEFFTKS